MARTTTKNYVPPSRDYAEPDTRVDLASARGVGVSARRPTRSVLVDDPSGDDVAADAADDSLQDRLTRAVRLMHKT